VIVDELKNCHRYFQVHAGFKKAFEFLHTFNKEYFEPQKFQIDGANLRAIVEAIEGRGRQKARLEAHRSYIDIQYTVQGLEEIGWRPYHQCCNVSTPYDEERDIEFFSDSALLWLPIHSGSFAIFFPEDGHAPLAGEGLIHKIIMKVAV
jgi:YhcH/YjgK/YiaL family protein